MKFLKKIALIVGLVALCLTGFWLGMKFSLRTVRTVETQRMIHCLEIYRNYRQHQDQKQLAEDLEKLNLSPLDFQKIIDRFIYYRTRKSSIDQAMMLLGAFRRGIDIQPVEVVEVSGFASEPFRLDAEILAVFESAPELVQEAFEG